MKINQTAPFKRSLITSALLVAMSGAAHATVFDNFATGGGITGDQSTAATAALIDIKLNAGGLGTVSTSAGTNTFFANTSNALVGNTNVNNLVITNAGGGIQTTGTGVNINTAVYTDPVMGLASSGTANTNIGNSTGNVVIKAADANMIAVNAAGQRVGTAYAGQNFSQLAAVDPTNDNVKSSFLAIGNDAKMYSENSATGAVVSSVNAGAGGVDIVGGVNNFVSNAVNGSNIGTNIIANTGEVRVYSLNGGAIQTTATSVGINNFGSGVGKTTDIGSATGTNIITGTTNINTTGAALTTIGSINPADGIGSGQLLLNNSNNTGLYSGWDLQLKADVGNSSGGAEAVVISAGNQQTIRSSIAATDINTAGTAATNIGNGTGTVKSSAGNSSIFANGTNALSSAAGATNVIVTSTGGGIQTTGTAVNINTGVYTDPVTGLSSAAIADTNIGNATGKVRITGLETVGMATLNQGLTVAGGASISGGLNNNGGGITNAGAISGATDITASGNVGSATSSTTGNSSVGGNQTVAGTLGVTGATTLGNTLSVASQSTTHGIGNTGLLANTGDFTNSGTAKIAGQTSTNGLDNTGLLANNGNLTNSGNATIGTAGTSTNIMQGATNTITSASAANPVFTNGNGSTVPASGTAGAISVYNTPQTIAAGSSIGGKLDGKQYQNLIQGNTAIDGNVMINGTLDYVSTNAATTSTIGGTAIPMVSTAAQPSQAAIAAAYTAAGIKTAAPTVYGQSGLVGAQAATLAAPAAASSQNSQVSTGSAVGNQVDLGNGNIIAAQNVGLDKTTGRLVDTTKAIAGTFNPIGVATVNQNSLTLTNGDNKTHGLVVGEAQTQISGGRNADASMMTLQDNQVHFQNASSGAPVRLSGVADGTQRYDAVNYGQLSDVAKNAYSGIAQVVAMSNISGGNQGKGLYVGVGTGYYRNQSAMAFGVSGNFNDNLQIRASVSTGFGSGDSMAAGGGITYKFW